MSKEVTKVCKFYKGEEQCPYTESYQQPQAMFWDYEKGFVHKYESGMYPGKTPEEAHKEFLDTLFPHLSDRNGAMDDGTWYRDMYERAEA